MNYLLLLLLSWFIAGTLKFSINLIMHRLDALALVGNGGFPSTHTTVVISQLVFVCLQHGAEHPAVASLMVLLWVVIMDAVGIRQRVQEHAVHLNRLNPENKHRERNGHTFPEIVAGLVLGVLIAVGYSQVALTF